MSPWSRASLLCGWVILAACGGASPRPETADADEASAEVADAEELDDAGAESKDEEDAVVAQLPTECHGSGDVCLPDPKWVKRLCNDVYPNVALHLFREGSPWTRGYATRKVKAWNASGGATSGEEWVAFDEEVILLYARNSNLGGMQVSGASGGYDALRWDGSCVTFSGEEVTTRPPPKAKHGRVDWRYLEAPIQEALRTDDAVNTAYRARRQECKGAFSGAVTKKCVQADEALVGSIIAAVRGGISLPQPTKLP
ncbi:MAG: hypothetical protein GX607_04465 [Myxococcales bacterium]|nr:hypothetical protein [Myxococcales bacterium]